MRNFWIKIPSVGRIYFIQEGHEFPVCVSSVAGFNVFCIVIIIQVTISNIFQIHVKWCCVWCPELSQIIFSGNVLTNIYQTLQNTSIIGGVVWWSGIDRFVIRKNWMSQEPANNKLLGDLLDNLWMLAPKLHQIAFDIACNRLIHTVSTSKKPIVSQDSRRMCNISFGLTVQFHNPLIFSVAGLALFSPFATPIPNCIFSQFHQLCRLLRSGLDRLQLILYFSSLQLSASIHRNQFVTKSCWAIHRYQSIETNFWR